MIGNLAARMRIGRRHSMQRCVTGIGAVWALRGGYGCTNPSFPRRGALQAHPTWITGFSDITALHGWASASGWLPARARGLDDYGDGCAGCGRHVRGVAHRANHKVQGPRRVVGGNLSVLFALLGTPYMPPLHGRWLLLEDLDEYLYHLDRMFVAFGQGGVFDAVEGVMVGCSPT